MSRGGFFPPPKEEEAVEEEEDKREKGFDGFDRCKSWGKKTQQKNLPLLSMQLPRRQRRLPRASRPAPFSGAHKSAPRGRKRPQEKERERD